MPETRQWNGTSYDRISGPMEELGRQVLARMELRGDELVLDAGCGSGRITELLADLLPHGRVIAVDGSASTAGFSRADCWLAPAPKQPEHPREFLATIVLGPHVQLLPEALREPFMDEVLAELGEPVIVDYVRLNIDATA
jgi:SAM-dependent methyltransferase